MKNSPFVLAVALVIALALPAVAAPCYTTSQTTADTGATDAGRFYVAVDNCIPVIGCTFSIWVYQESNGIDGLQRRDEMRSDIAQCSDGTQPDSVVF